MYPLPFLFLLTIDFVIERVTSDSSKGIPWADDTRLIDLGFADDIVLFSEYDDDMQNIRSSLEQLAGRLGLRSEL